MNLSKLTPRQKKVAIGISLSVVAIGILLYYRNKNQKDATAILDYVAKMPSQVDISQATDAGMELVRGTKIDLNKMKIDNLYGAYKNALIKKAIANTVVELYSAMKGGGTDVKAFMKALTRIKNKNTLAFIDKVYNAQFKEGLFEAMKGESALNSVTYAAFSDKTKYDLAIPFLSEGKWHPALASYFNAIPTY